ncbi:MAG: DUF115 domain-containing protein [Candidatus Methanomethylophilaceae archaeon]|nr:DUF115 domain-containing protein [Candidatus Methanomethylophilaceae archaeon]
MIAKDLGLDEFLDSEAVKVLKWVTLNSDLVDDEDYAHLFQGKVTVVGNSPDVLSKIPLIDRDSTIVAAGSAASAVVSSNIPCQILVTDLDGPIGPQLELSSRGALTFILAHGDNTDLVRGYAGQFDGPVILTSQVSEGTTFSCYGGFSDGDRAVCIARHFGCRHIDLAGFDYDNPSVKDGSDQARKLKKLRWARYIIEDLNPPGVEIRMLRPARAYISDKDITRR